MKNLTFSPCRILIALLLPLCLSGCDSRTGKKELNRLTEDVQEAIDLAQQKFDDVSPDGSKLHRAASDEIEKLFSYEYTIKELDPSLSTTQLQAELDMLGMERWDCFSIQNINAQLRIICKRRPKTYLRYLIPDLL